MASKLSLSFTPLTQKASTCIAPKSPFTPLTQKASTCIAPKSPFTARTALLCTEVKAAEAKPRRFIKIEPDGKGKDVKEGKFLTSFKGKGKRNKKHYRSERHSNTNTRRYITYKTVTINEDMAKDKHRRYDENCTFPINIVNDQ